MVKKTDLQQIGTILDERLDQKLKPIKRVLNRHSQKLEAHSESLVIIEKAVEVLPDLATEFYDF